jgi:Transcriptional regulatory protein, C terminal
LLSLNRRQTGAGTARKHEGCGIAYRSSVAGRRILLICDDPKRAAVAASHLRDDGYTMTSTGALASGRADAFDRVIVDGEIGPRQLIEPRMCSIFSDGVYPPLTMRAPDGELEIVVAVRPYSRTTSADIEQARAATASSDAAKTAVAVVVIDDVRLDHLSRSVHLRSEELHLDWAEFDVLATLIEHAGRVVIQSDLLQAVWPDAAKRPWRAPAVHIAALRRKLDRPVNVPSHISTIRGIGYRFETR